MVTSVQSLKLVMTASPMPVVRVTWIVPEQEPVRRVETQPFVLNWSNAMMALPMPAALVTRIAQVLVQGRPAVMAKRVQSLSSAMMALSMRVVAATLIAPLLARVLLVATVSSAQN